MGIFEDDGRVARRPPALPHAPDLRRTSASATSMPLASGLIALE
jgi:hypothetical protein